MRNLNWPGRSGTLPSHLARSKEDPLLSTALHNSDPVDLEPLLQSHPAKSQNLLLGVQSPVFLRVEPFGLSWALDNLHKKTKDR